MSWTLKPGWWLRLIPQFDTIDNTSRLPATLYNSHVSGKPQAHYVSAEGSFLSLTPLPAWPCSNKCGMTLCLVATGESTLIMLPRPSPPFLYPSYPPVAGDSIILPSALLLHPLNEWVLYCLSHHHALTVWWLWSQYSDTSWLQDTDLNWLINIYPPFSCTPSWVHTTFVLLPPCADRTGNWYVTMHSVLLCLSIHHKVLRNVDLQLALEDMLQSLQPSHAFPPNQSFETCQLQIVDSFKLGARLLWPHVVLTRITCNLVMVIDDIST